MKSKAIFFFLTSASFLLNGGQAVADDLKYYAPSQCERWNENVDPANYLGSSRRFNPSTKKNLRLDCPAIRDRSGDVSWSSISVIDRNPTDRVCANFVWWRQSGAAVTFKQTPRKCTGSAHNSPSAVWLSTGGLTGIPGGGGHYYFSVNHVPKRYAGNDSGVVHYTVNEVIAAD